MFCAGDCSFVAGKSFLCTKGKQLKSKVRFHPKRTPPFSARVTKLFTHLGTQMSNLSSFQMKTHRVELIAQFICVLFLLMSPNSIKMLMQGGTGDCYNDSFYFLLKCFS